MATEYTAVEKQALDIMRRTDFKNLSKNDVLSIASKLSELRPDVAKEVIAQFPEFAKLIQSSMEEYKDILGNIVSSDDESVKQVYTIADKDMDTSADSRKQFYDFAGKVHADLSKCLIILIYQLRSARTFWLKRWKSSRLSVKKTQKSVPMKLRLLRWLIKKTQRNASLIGA